MERKFTVRHDDAPPHVLALAAVVVALGGTYWLIRDSDGRRHGTVTPTS